MQQLLLFVLIAAAGNPLAAASGRHLTNQHVTHTPPKLTVLSCEPNKRAKHVLAGTSRTANYLEEVVVSNARANRPVYLAYHKADAPQTKKDEFVDSNCGKVAGKLGTVTSLLMDLFRLTSGRQLKGKADATGEATFLVPVNKCGKMYYQAYDWTNNKSCQQTSVANLAYQPPPPAPSSSPPPASANIFPYLVVGSNENCQTACSIHSMGECLQSTLDLSTVAAAAQATLDDAINIPVSVRNVVGTTQTTLYNWAGITLGYPDPATWTVVTDAQVPAISFVNIDQTSSSVFEFQLPQTPPSCTDVGNSPICVCAILGK